MTIAAEHTLIPQGPGPGVRVVYRSPEGHWHDDWPADRIAEALREEKGALWIDVEDPGNGNTRAVEALLRDVFGFHQLAIDDALRESHQPKVDDWGDYLYTVFHTVAVLAEDATIKTRELDLFLGPNYLVSFHTEPLEVLDQLRALLRRDAGARLAQGPDRLLYHLFDLAADQYLEAIEQLVEAIDEAQDEILSRPGPETLRRIFQVKRSAMRLHRVLAPQREVFNRLARDDYPAIDPASRVYFRDVYDHVVRVHDIAESLRDLIASALDTYLSAVSNRTNDVVKTLTIVTVLVLPLNLLAGFFGMNFFGGNIELPGDRLPHTAFFIAVCLTMVTAPGLLWLVGKRRGWF